MYLDQFRKIFKDLFKMVAGPTYWQKVKKRKEKKKI